MEPASLAADGRRNDRRDSNPRRRVAKMGDSRRMATRATYVLVLLRLGRLEGPIDPFLHVEAVLGERGDVLKEQS